MSFNTDLFNSQYFGGGTSGSALQGTRGRTIIYHALRIARILARAGRTESPDEASDALHVLNALIDSWSTERLAIPSVQPATYEWTAGVESYTIGEGADLEAVRPVRILRANLVDADGNRTPLELLNLDRFAVRPAHCGLYYDQQSPVGTLYRVPAPSETEQVELFPWVPLTGFASADVELFLPTGYLRALEYNLAIELHARCEYAQPLAQSVYVIAADAKAAAKRANARPITLSSDPGLAGRGRYDYRRGY
jgi:hypothetical protein